MAVLGAGAAPVAGPGLGALALLLGFIVLYTMQTGYRATLRRILLGLANTIEDIKIGVKFVGAIHPFTRVANALRYVDKQIDRALGSAALACEKGAVVLLNKMWSLLVWMVREQADVAVTVGQALGLVKARDIPAAVATAVKPVQAGVKAGVRAAHAAELHADALFGRARAGIDKVQRTLTKTITKAVAKVGARVGRLERGVSSRAWWKRHLTSTLGWAAITAIVGTALGRLGLRWLRCGNVKKAGRSVCNMRGDLLDDLLLGLTTLTIGLELVAFAEEMGEVVEDTAAFIGDRVT